MLQGIVRQSLPFVCQLCPEEPDTFRRSVDRLHLQWLSSSNHIAEFYQLRRQWRMPSRQESYQSYAAYTWSGRHCQLQEYDCKLCLLIIQLRTAALLCCRNQVWFILPVLQLLPLNLSLVRGSNSNTGKLNFYATSLLDLYFIILVSLQKFHLLVLLAKHTETPL